jgi:uncharacterized protein with ATP-grasp and redox domains
VEACEYATEDVTLRYRALKEVIRYLNDMDLCQMNHVKIGSDVHRTVKEITGNLDPYRQLKRLSNSMALEWLAKLEKELGNNLPFMPAVSIAAAGNMIDYGAMKTHETPKTLFEKALKGKLDSRKVEEAKQFVKESRQVLYLCDNAGEIAFDKLLVSAIRSLGPEVTVVVRGGPIMNDVTLEDAYEVGMITLAKTISTGTAISGILLDESSPEFQDAFDRSDLIISKGQGNMESLIDIRRKRITIYILKVKCNLIANHLKSEIGSTEIFFQRANSIDF